MNCPFCNSQQFRVHQKNGHSYSTMFRCVACRRFFSERRFSGYSGLKLPPEKIARIVHCLVEGVSVRATARLVDVQKNTVLRVLRHAGRLCQRVMDSRLNNLHLNYLQADEIWSYVGKKEDRVLPKERDGEHHVGDTWIFLVTDSETKLVPCFAVGDRNLYTAERLMTDLASRLINRPQISTDGLRAYAWGIERAFGSDVDYGQVIKSYAEVDGRLELTGAQPRAIIGRPKLRHISTSHAERNNLNCRLFCRRLTRLTNAFSRRVENLEAALWVYFAHWNFCRQHTTLRVSPCMEARVTDHIWTIEELLNAGASS
jgi:transposase-like protein/IS1 family transposase